MYGLYSPVCRSIVMSRKSTVLRLTCIVIFSPLSLNILQISVLVFSACLGGCLQVASPSSL